MKSKSFIPVVASIFVYVIASSGADAAAKNEKQQTTPPSAQKKAAPANNASALSDEIVGEWEMVGSVVDTNNNLQIDAAERAKLKPAMKAYMKLNRDGSGLFTVSKMPGRLEITDRSGKKFLTWYDKAEGRHRIGTLVKVTSDELHIKEPGGNGLFIWKRL